MPLLRLTIKGACASFCNFFLRMLRKNWQKDFALDSRPRSTTLHERCVAYVDCEDLFRLPPDYTHADVIDSSYGHIKVLDHRGAYVSVPCTYLDIK